jgi:hypothetical protein
MMMRSIAAVFLSAGFVTAQAEASQRAEFWSALDHDGTLSAGWVQVLPILASACGLRLDSRELNSNLVDLSLDTGNISYATNLYSTLDKIERNRAKNDFVTAWTAMFRGKQKEACDTAEAFWGNSGKQFPGILKREVQADVTNTIPSSRANNCQ